MKAQGVIGSLIMAAGGLSPLIHIPIAGSWNYFDLDQRLAIVFYILVALGLIGAFTEKIGLIRLTGWGGLILLLVTLLGVYLKSHDSFSFLHFKKLVDLAAGLVKYKWGWYVILTGILLLITVRRPKSMPVN